MEKHFYILLTKEFCETNADYQKGVCGFNYAITKDNRYVASANSLNEFPELFTEVPEIIS